MAHGPAWGLEGLGHPRDDLLILCQELAAQLLPVKGVLARGIGAVGDIYVAHVVLGAQAAAHVAEQAPQDVNRGIQLPVEVVGMWVEEFLVPCDVAHEGPEVRDDAVELHQPLLLRAVGVEGREVRDIGGA